MSTEETIKALAAEILEPVYKKCHPGIDEWSFDYWKRNVPFGKAIISAMCEMYKEGYQTLNKEWSAQRLNYENAINDLSEKLAATERVECYLPVKLAESDITTRDLDGRVLCLKKTVLTVVRESEPSKEQSQASVASHSSTSSNSNEQSEIGIWLQEQLKFFTSVEGEIVKVSDYAGGLSIKFKNGNGYTLKLSKQCQVTLD